MKNWAGLIICFLVSAAIWLVFSMSQTYSQIINVPVLVTSDIEGHSRTSSRQITIAARCRAQGFQLIQFNVSKEASPVFIDAASLRQVDEETFLLPQATVIKYSENIFGDDVKVESILSEDMPLNFPVENYIKVPVILNAQLSYHRQYMSPKPATASPDSVLVYGAPENLRDIDGIETELVRSTDLKNTVHGNVRLKTPAGFRTSVDEVEYYIPVCRYVDLSATKEIEAVNVPSGTDFLVLPAKATVTVKCYFPVDKNPFESLELYVDYCEYENSLSGKCRIKADGAPGNVISLDIDPEFCNCIQNVR